MAYARPGVYITERLLPPVLQNGATADAAGAIVATFAQGPETVTLVRSWYEFTSYFGGYNASYPATFQVAQFFNNGGRELYVRRLLHSDAVTASATLLNSSSATVATVTSKNAGVYGNNLYVILSASNVGSNYYNLYLYKDLGDVNTYTPTVTGLADDLLIESYLNVRFDDSTSSDYAPTVINNLSPNITVAVTGTGSIVTTNPYPLTGGSDGSAVTKADYITYKGGTTTAFNDFTPLNRPLVVFLPGLSSLLSSGDMATVQATAASWAASNKAFVVCQTPSGLTAANALTYASSVGASSSAAIYYPHLYIADPLGRGTGSLRRIGPEGAVAGLYLGTDTSRGVFKAPAGIQTVLQGVVALESSLSSSDLDSLNSATQPVNAIRQIPGAGLSVMGARTLLQDGTANRYVNMRRSLNYIEAQLNNITQFAIFENNDENLWSRIRTTINVFLNDYRNKGGLRGATAAQAYFILCDATNNTPTTIANGEVHIQVGVALQYPAEFIVIDLSQKTIV